MNTESSSNLFKQREQDFSRIVDQGSLLGIRCDGRAFHTFTKNLEKPFDRTLMDHMDNAAMHTITQVFPRALFGYVQSDEFTIFAPVNSLDFSGRLEKILSLSGSAATAGFMKNHTGDAPMFDARAFRIDNLAELQEYMDWRRLDARKNAFTMAAEALYDSKTLMNISTPERIKLLKGTKFEKLPEDFVNGRLIVREEFQGTVEFFHKGLQETRRTLVTRSEWVSKPAERDVTQNIVSSF